MPSWDTSCPDWEDRILAGRPLVPELPLFEEEAERAVRIFRRLRLPDVIGNPPMAEASGEWFLPIVAALFGAYDVATNIRMIQEAFLLVPKKNGKSSYAAAIMVVALIVNRRPSAEFLLIAPTKEIANIAFRQARGIIKVDPELSKLLHPQDNLKTITHRMSGATLQIKAADTDVITGSKSTGILVDETHVFAKRANAAQIFVEIRGALAARPDGFMIQISTQSKDPPAGVFRSELNTARDVRDGKIRLPLLPVIYELPDRIAKDGGWKDARYWPLINPNLDRSVSRDFLARELLKAEREGPSALSLLASQHFNVEIGLSLRTDRWAGAGFWQACADPTLTFEALLERAEVIVAGVDGGGLDDLLSMSFLGRDRATRKWLLWGHSWVHESVLELRKSEASKLEDFAAAGELTIVPDMDEAFADLAERCKAVDEAGLLDQIGMDPVGVGLIVDALAAAELAKDSLGKDRIVGVSQGYKLQGAIKTAEVKLASGQLLHANQAIAAWAVGNAKVETKGNAITITKQASGTAKIDPLMSAFDAVALMSMNPIAQGPSVYETRGLLEIEI